MKQPVEYEWKPKFCKRCQRVGHCCDDKPKQVNQQWKPKEKKVEDKIVIRAQEKKEVVPEDETKWTTIKEAKRGRR